MALRPRLSCGQIRKLGLESLEDRRLLTATPTPAQAITALLSQQTVVAAQTTAVQANIQASQNDLLNLDRQLAGVNLQRVQIDTHNGNVQAATADLQQRSSITAAGNRISSEFNTTIAGLTTANALFRSETTTLVSALERGTITPVAALAAQQVDYVAFQVSANVAQSHAMSSSDLELQNMADLTYQVEGYQGQQNLGTFHGGFDVKSAGVGGLQQDFTGVATTHLTQSASLLQGTFTGASGDYLQALSTPAGGTPTVVKQPITGGTLTATVSRVPHPDGFTIHGTIHLIFAAVGNIPAHTQDLQFAANLNAKHFLVGQILVGGHVVGNLDWGRLSS